MINSGVIAESYRLNQKISEFEGYDLDDFVIPFKLSNEQIILETIKKCEYDDSIILRLYEPYGRKNTVTLSLLYEDIKAIYATDMLEHEKSEFEFNHNKVKLNFNPFEIKTIKIVL